MFNDLANCYMDNLRWSVDTNKNIICNKTSFLGWIHDFNLKIILVDRTFRYYDVFLLLI